MEMFQISSSYIFLSSVSHNAADVLHNRSTKSKYMKK